MQKKRDSSRWTFFMLLSFWCNHKSSYFFLLTSLMCGKHCLVFIVRRRVERFFHAIEISFLFCIPAWLLLLNRWWVIMSCLLCWLAGELAHSFTGFRLLTVGNLACDFSARYFKVTTLQQHGFLPSTRQTISLVYWTCRQIIEK